MAVRAEPMTHADLSLFAQASILVVDDQASNVTLLERVLEGVGTRRVVGVTDARRALDAYRSLRPDAVLLDLHMPHVDGLELMGMLAQAIGPDAFVPVVVVTADATDRAKQAALEAGAADFLTKPFDRTEVLLRVKNLLRTRAMHLALQRHNASLSEELQELQKRREDERREAAAREAKRRRIEEVLARRAFGMVFQPIVELDTRRRVGVEALARFTELADRRPDLWFAEAAEVGLGIDLELAAVGAAIDQLPALAEPLYMSVNVSPTTLCDGRLIERLGPVAPRVVVELTEHVEVAAYDCLDGALSRLRKLGVRVAVDDTGSGFASLSHVLRVDPAIIKLDIGLVRGIDRDPARRALAAALVNFSGEVGCALVAEGVETHEETETLRHLGVRHGQGYHLGRPAPLM